MHPVARLLIGLAVVGCSADVVVDVDAGGKPTPGSGPQGGSACVDEVLAVDERGARSVVMVDGTLYWSTGDGSIFRRSAGETSNVALVTGLDAAASLAVHRPYVYFATKNAVARFHEESERIEPIASELATPLQPVWVGNALYWLNYGSGILAGNLMRWEPGGDAEVVVAFLQVPKGLAADQTSLYVLAKSMRWDNDIVMGALLRLPIDGGDDNIEVSGIQQPAGLTVTDDRIYWIEQVDDSFSLPGRVAVLEKTGGAEVTLASIDGLGLSTVADADAVLFSVFGLETSRVRHVAAAGDVTDVIELSGSFVVDIAMDADHIIVASMWGIDGVPPGTPSVQRLCHTN